MPEQSAKDGGLWIAQQGRIDTEHPYGLRGHADSGVAAEYGVANRFFIINNDCQGHILTQQAKFLVPWQTID